MSASLTDPLLNFSKMAFTAIDKILEEHQIQYLRFRLTNVTKTRVKPSIMILECQDNHGSEILDEKRMEPIYHDIISRLEQLMSQSNEAVRGYYMCYRGTNPPKELIVNMAERFAVEGPEDLMCRFILSTAEDHTPVAHADYVITSHP